MQATFLPHYAANPVLWSALAALATVAIVGGTIMLIACGIGRAIERAEKSLQASESRYRSLFHGSPSPLREEDFSEVKIYLDQLRAAGVANPREYFQNHPEAVRQCAAKVKILDVNQAALDLHQAVYKQDLLAGLPMIFTDKTYDSFGELLIAAANGKTVFDTETPVRTLHGDDRHLLLRWVVAPGSEQTLAKVYVSQTDITERKRAEEALRGANQHLRIYERLVESSPNVVVVVDRQHVYRMVNAQFLGRRRKSAGEILGQTVEEVLGEEDFERVRPYLDQSFAGEVVRDGDWFTYPDVGRRFLEVSYYPLSDEKGETDAVVAEIHDATDRKCAQESLEGAKEAAEAANHAKSAVPGQHEPRNPHPDDGHPRPRRSHVGRRLRSRDPGDPGTHRRDQAQRRAPHERDRRYPRPLEDRSREAPARADPLLTGPTRGRSRFPDASSSRREATEADHGNGRALA